MRRIIRFYTVSVCAVVCTLQSGYDIWPRLSNYMPTMLIRFEWQFYVMAENTNTLHRTTTGNHMPNPHSFIHTYSSHLNLGFSQFMCR